MLDAGDTDLEVYKDETGEYRYVKTGEKVPVRYAPTVGLDAVQQRKQGSGTGMESDISKYVKKMATDSAGNFVGKNGSGVTLEGGQGISYAPVSEGGSGLASASGWSSTAGYSAGDLGSGISAGSSSGGLSSAAGYGASDLGGGISANAGIDSSSLTSSTGGGWGSAFTGAIAGVTAATNRREKYKAEGREDPVMERAKADGFGQEHEDWRDIAGGGTLGAVVGYFGGPVGSALAGPIVDAVHPYGEKLSRTMVNLGDDLGGVGGAMLTDPIGAIASGKYSYEDTFWGGLLGPAYDLFD